MKKKYVFWASTALVIFIAITYACEMPHSVELRSDKFETNAPIKIARFNIATVLTEALKDSFPEGFEVYDMINYRGAQAFLIGYQMDLVKSFNPDDYLRDLSDPEGIDPIYPEPIVIPKLTSDEVSDWFYFNMDGFFQDMQARINNESTEVTSAVLVHPNPVMGTLNNMPEFMVFNTTSGEPNFDSVFVHTGKIVLNIWLTGAPAGLTVQLTDIELKGSTDGNAIGSPANIPTVTIDNENDADNPRQVVINIDEETIEVGNPPKFHLGGITSAYTGTGPVTYTLSVQPELRDIKLRGAEALKIGRMEEPLPQEIVENIDINAADGLLNAVIAVGQFRINANPPPKTETPSTTYCEGLYIGYEIVIEQDSVWLDTEEFEGLNETFIRDYPSLVNPPLVGKKISGKDLRVNEGQSKIIIQADSTNGVTFELFDDTAHLPHNPYTNKELPVKLDMGMDIDELSVVRWKSSVLPPIDIPEIDFANMGEQNVSFIRSITFDDIYLNIDFTVPDPPPSPPPGREQLTSGSSGLPSELENHIALKVSCPDLGFDENDPDNTRPLHDGKNTFTGGHTKMDVHDPDPDNPAPAKKVKFDVELVPVDSNGDPSPYLEFGPVDMRDKDDIIMNIYAQATVDFTWTEAVVNLKAAMEETEMEEHLTGTFPEDTADPVDLSELEKYMHGIAFGGIAAEIFLSGPNEIIEKITPVLSFNAQWDEETKKLEMLTAESVTAGAQLPKLPGKNSKGEWVYSGAKLPEQVGGLILTGFNELIANFPADLRFYYEMDMEFKEEFTIYPAMFDENAESDSGIKALMVLLLPLELIAEPGGYFAIPSDLFGGEEGEEGEDGADLFGRENLDDSSLFTGVNIKSLGLRIDFGYPLFAGSYLHFDKYDKLFGNNGLRLGGGNSLNVTFTGAQQKIIDENLIYPDIKFVYPNGGTVRIARNFLPIRIVISASGSYTMDLDDLLGAD